MTQFALAGLCALVTASAAWTQDVVAHAELPDALQALLIAASQSEDEGAFASTVGVLLLTQTGEAVMAGAGLISPERAAEAAEILGLEVEAQTDPALGLNSDGERTAQTPTASELPAWRAAPMGMARAVVNGESEIWSGEARLGVRLDAGNTDREDYVLGLKAERALSTWGFEASLDYGYSETDGVVGRDDVRLFSQIDREAGDRWTLYANGEYRQNPLSGFDFTGLLGGGIGYRLYDDEQFSWALEAGPALRILQPIGGDLEQLGVLELRSSANYQLSANASLASNTSVLMGNNARAEQAFTLDSALNPLWTFRMAFHYMYEFSPEPGFENADTRTDIALVRKF